MKKALVGAVALLCLLTACNTAGSTSSLTNSYHYGGETDVQVDGRSFVLEDTPQNLVEEAVILDFYYSITAEFDKKYDILADIEPHRISIENEKQHFQDGRYVQSYTIHTIETLDEDQYTTRENADGTPNPLYYYNLSEEVSEYSLVEYAVVHATFTQVLSPQATQAGPQYGDGTYSRSFLVGRAASDDRYKIYSYGMM